MVERPGSACTMPRQVHTPCRGPGGPLGAAPRLLAGVLLLAVAAAVAAVPPPAMPLPQQQQQRAAARYAPGWVIVKLKPSASAAPTVAAAAAAMPAAAATPLTPSKHGLAFVQPLSADLSGSSSGGGGSPTGRRLAAVAAHRTGSVPGMYRIVDGAKVPAKLAQLAALPGGLKLRPSVHSSVLQLRSVFRCARVNEAELGSPADARAAGRSAAYSAPETAAIRPQQPHHRCQSACHLTPAAAPCLLPLQRWSGRYRTISGSCRRSHNQAPLPAEAAAAPPLAAAAGHKRRAGGRGAAWRRRRCSRMIRTSPMERNGTCQPFLRPKLGRS